MTFVSDGLTAQRLGELFVEAAESNPELAIEPGDACVVRAFIDVEEAPFSLNPWRFVCLFHLLWNILPQGILENYVLIGLSVIIQ